ncbi:hypothetical protein MKP08_00925 [Erythrobacter sp. LQ02-29]|uniref:pyroglutamyl-peptidase I family protein n=1 Tax=Erythrobacter sp. LQ02-29 TaxID=2920384 RepID=UPI001F4D5213|nr:hypothetical protein [Erythrobacter sp. LQ02-29]MCP9221313.1 hypothetical protein [Erythrobacter sp. LQ02-29]
MSKSRVAITGFRPFPGVPTNPSATLIDSLRGDTAWAQQHSIQPIFHLLDTVYADLDRTVGKLFADEPAALILTGYSRIATGLKLETGATSVCSPVYADASGFTPPKFRDPVSLKANRSVDFAALVDRLRRADVPAYLSDDAGAYVCNRSYWLALDHVARAGLSTRVLFLHLPAIAGMADGPPGGSGAMELATMQRGLGIVAHALA